MPCIMGDDFPKMNKGQIDMFLILSLYLIKTVNGYSWHKKKTKMKNSINGLNSIEDIATERIDKLEKNTEEII